MTSPDTLPGSSPETFADGFGNHPEPRLQQVGMAGPQHGFRQVSRIRAAEGDRAFPPVYVHHAAGYDGVPDQLAHVFGGLVSTSDNTFWSINPEKPDPHLPEREGVAVNHAREANKLRAMLISEHGAGDHHDEQHQQRREQAEDNRPNLLRRWIDRDTILGVAFLLAAAAGGVLTGIVLIRFAAHLLS